jgi:hypothetical protein
MLQRTKAVRTISGAGQQVRITPCLDASLGGLQQLLENDKYYTTTPERCRYKQFLLWGLALGLIQPVEI